MRSPLSCRILRLAMTAVFVCSSLWMSAQTAQTGAVSGQVTDPSGSVLPGVTVKVTSNSTGQVREASTQGNGRYLVPLLPPGQYKVEAGQQGFKTATVEQVRV